MRQAILIILLLVSIPVHSEPLRHEHEISGDGWRLWRDMDAEWLDDELHLPPVNLGDVAVHPPTCGWDALEYRGIDVSVPGTVEEHFWGANGNVNGIAADYRGVSWWSTSFTVDSSLRGKKIVLAFDSVNMRAEIFVNRKLAGYDLIGNSPFSIDISDAVRFGGENTLDIRITDPGGTFNWNDFPLMLWGKNRFPAVHSFGGITGRIILKALDRLYIDDIYVENKPDITSAEIFVSLSNETDTEISGTLELVVHKKGSHGEVLITKRMDVSVPRDGLTVSIPVKSRNAEIWDIGSGNLYNAAVTVRSGDKRMADHDDRHFGFRWFDVKANDGDRQFYLNGKRIFLIAGLSRGFWPKNGIYPNPEKTVQDIALAADLGFNMMKFHRAIGQQYVIEHCDGVGMLTFEELGGYACRPGPDEFAKAWRREKLRRMVMRDRSSPSMVLYGLKNEAIIPPDEDDDANMRMVHELDPMRIIKFNSNRNKSEHYSKQLREDPIKRHLLPGDDTFLDYGWHDHHHWPSLSAWDDSFYENPQFFKRLVLSSRPYFVPEDSLNVIDTNEIIFWGEEGGIHNMARTELIKNEIARTAPTGWREREYLSYFESFDRFLDISGYRKAFSTVDDLTLSLGTNMFDYHGRMIENTLLTNFSDAYVLDGYSTGFGMSSGIADVYRNPTGEPDVFKKYTRPLYVAVKIRDKVLPSGSIPVADIWLVNRADLKGVYKLDLKFTAPCGKTVFEESRNVRISGGERFGQLLVEGLELPAVKTPGYFMLSADLIGNKNHIAADGSDEIFVIDYAASDIGLPKIAVVDTTGSVQSFLNAARGVAVPEYDPSDYEVDCLILGGHNMNIINQVKRKLEFVHLNPLLEHISNGMTLIVLENAGQWANQLDNRINGNGLQYFNRSDWTGWAKYFCGKSVYLDGLPDGQALNWEYQWLNRGGIGGLALDPLGLEYIIAAGHSARQNILTPLVRIPFGRGQIFLSTLNILEGISSDDPQSVVAKKLLLNMIEKKPKLN